MLKGVVQKSLNVPLFVRGMSSASSSKNVAFLGLGSMGKPMAANLVKQGFVVKGFDVNKDILDGCSEVGVTPVSTIKDACKDADYVITALPKGEHVEAVMFDSDGVLDSTKKGSCILDVSTVSPMLAKQISEEADGKGLIFCDCPMAGGTPGAKAGTLVFMVGSKSEDHFNRAKVVLDSMGKKVFHCGAPGTGQSVKISHNLTLGINMIASVEGIVLGERLGIDPKLLIEILQSSTSANACMGIYNPYPGINPNSPSSRNYEDGFQTALMKKDIGLAV